jgi:hypothetical protein
MLLVLLDHRSSSATAPTPQVAGVLTILWKRRTCHFNAAG